MRALRSKFRKRVQERIVAIAAILSLGGIGCLAQSAPTSDSLSLLRNAGEAIAAGKLQVAENELQSVLRTSPDEYHALNFLGIVRAQQGKNTEAETLFKRVIQKKPDFASARVNLGMLYVQMSRPDDAVAEFQKALQIDPQRSDARAQLLGLLRNQAQAALQAHDPERALALLTEARKEAPNDPQVLYDFGMVALRMSLYSDAIQTFQTLLDRDDKNAKALYGLGRAQIGLAKYEDARATFERYVTLVPEDASGHYALGLALAPLQQFPQAHREFQQSIELKPIQTESYFQLGLLSLNSGNLDSATNQFSLVLQRDPHHAGALTGMGQVQFQKKHYADAADFLEQAIAKDPSLREAHYYLGLTYARLGKKEDSEKQLQITRELDQQEVNAHNARVKIVNPGETTPSAEVPNKEN